MSLEPEMHLPRYKWKRKLTTVSPSLLSKTKVVWLRHILQVFHLASMPQEWCNTGIYRPVGVDGTNKWGQATSTYVSQPLDALPWCIGGSKSLMIPVGRYPRWVLEVWCNRGSPDLIGVARPFPARSATHLPLVSWFVVHLMCGKRVGHSWSPFVLLDGPMSPCVSHWLHFNSWCESPLVQRVWWILSGLPCMNGGHVWVGRPRARP